MPGSKSFARLIHRRVILVLHAVNFTASWVFSLELTRYLLLPTAHWELNFHVYYYYYSVCRNHIR